MSEQSTSTEIGTGLPVDIIAILARMQDQIDDLTATVETQQQQLDDLRRPRTSTGGRTGL